jgi:lipid II:glycine glycyltransferase (peptidoglycan interpeptide bridge formation enzyme)
MLSFSSYNNIVTYPKRVHNRIKVKPDRTIRFVSDAEIPIWDTVVNHPLQSRAWGEFRARMGIEVVRIGVFQNNKLTGGWQFTLHKVPYLPLKIGYFPKGPLPTPEMIQTLRSFGQKKNVCYIQIEPDITAEETFSLKNLPGLRPANHPLFTRYTFVLDLTKSEDELMKSFHPKTRYNIRLAQRHGVVVKEDNSDTAFLAYLKLSEETTRRQGFYSHNRQYHTTLWKTFGKSGGAKLFTATYQNTIVSAWMVFIFKDTMYYPYGASSRNYKEVMAPNLLLWEIMLYAKRSGLFYFDLWGSLGPEPDTRDPWYGFHRFKEGYHPELIEFAGSFDLVIRPFWYKLLTIADTIRWKLLTFRARR